MKSDFTAKKSQDDKCMTLDITNFGPISKGTVAIKPLTILFGPNGCGKSHVAALAYATIMAESHMTQKMLLPMTSSHNVLHTVVDDILTKRRMNRNFVVDAQIYETIINDMLEVFFKTLPDYLLLNHKQLIRHGQEKFVLGVASDILDGKIQYDNSTPKFTIQNTKSLGFNPISHGKRHSRQQSISNNMLIIDIPRTFLDQIFNLYEQPADQILQETEEDEFTPSVDYRRLRYDVSWYMRQALERLRKIRRGIYFPSERGGLTLAQKSLTLHYYNMRGKPLVSSPDPGLSSMYTDFLGMLLLYSKQKNDFVDVASDFEKKALKGTVNVEHGTNNNMPNVTFKQNNESIPINASASSVKDLASFLLYLKHNAKRQDLVILEEPETCLHPNNQILLAMLLATLVNKGLHIMVTTHSPFFTEKLSHCIVSGEKHAGSGPGSELNPEDLRIHQVAVYKFVDDNGDGYQIVPIDVDDEGIPQYEFTRVFDRLYNELLELERDS